MSFQADLPQSKIQWQIQLFSALRVERDSQVTDRFETRRAASLLAYLAFYPHRVHSREEMAEMLWPDEEMDVTRLRLRQVLNTIRRALDSPDGTQDGILIADRTFVRINADVVTTDVSEFENARKAANRAESVSLRIETLTQAAALYTGDLLPGFYEEWVEPERSRLRAAFRETLFDLAAAQIERNETASGLEHARRALALDALDEEVNAMYLRLCLLAGRPAEALRQYQHLEQALWKETRALPAAALQSLAAEARAFRASVPAAVSSSASVPPSTPAVSLRSEFEVRPKDNPVPETADFCPPALPAALTPFFGRQQEIDQLVSLLRPAGSMQGEPPQVASALPGAAAPSVRLVTLVGLGGSGKTRLAQEAARALQASYAQRVWFVPLEEITEARTLLDRIADALYPDSAFSESGRAGQEQERIIETLGRCPALLVLDNFEQLTEEGSAVVQTLLKRVASLRCLITSRRVLNIAGERKVELMPLPTPKAAEDWQSVGESPSVRLFVDRARNANPDFALTPLNAPDVAALCRHLEGFPLALELAAAWMTILDPAGLLRRMEDRFAILVAQQQDTPARQQSLYAIVEWSNLQLAPNVQRFFAGLSVFHGGWTLEAAEAVCAEPQAISFLALLQRHSLILRQDAAAGGRLRMLETLREFTRSRLDAATEGALRRRHAEYYLGLAERAAPHLTGAQQSHWMEQLQQESENFRAAIGWCMMPEGSDDSDSRVTIGLRFVNALWRFWDVRCHSDEAEAWIETLLERASCIDDTLRARALDSAGCLALTQCRHALAQQHLEACIQLYEAGGDGRSMGHALGALAATMRDGGDVGAAKILFDRSLHLMRECRDVFGMARALGGLGVIAALEEDYACAHSLLEQSAAMYRLCGHQKGLSWCCYERGVTAHRQGDAALRLKLFQEGLPISRALNDSKNILFACYNIGAVYRERKAFSEAEEVGREAVLVARQSGMTVWEIRWLIWFGDLACDQKHYEQSRAFYQAAYARSIQAQNRPNIRQMLERMALLAYVQKDIGRAVCLFGASETLPPDVPLDLPNEPLFITEELRSDLRIAGHLPAWASARRKGLALSFEQITEYMLISGAEAEAD